MDGPIPRNTALEANAFPRRSAVVLAMRRPTDEGFGLSYRSIEMHRGRKGTDSARRMSQRGLDWGAPAPQILEAMLIPRLGLKDPSKNELPKLTKYEQPKKEEDGINIEKDNTSGTPLEFKEFFEKEAQVDKRRKKKKKNSLDEIIDAPDDDDPRKRPSQLDEIVGVAEGSTRGDGVVGKAGNIYLGKVIQAIKDDFKVPVFISADEMASLSLEIIIMKMDSSGNILAYKLVRASPNNGFNSAAISAIKRFMPGEGGDKSLPAPAPDMLELINKHGLLVRLDGKRL